MLLTQKPTTPHGSCLEHGRVHSPGYANEPNYQGQECDFTQAGSQEKSDRRRLYLLIGASSLRKAKHDTQSLKHHALTLNSYEAQAH